jgi:uncharacterized protein (TIGR02302 family)
MPRDYFRQTSYDVAMPSNPRVSAGGKLERLERAIRRARLAMASERIWPRIVPVLSIVGLYVVLSWLGYWRLGGDYLRAGTLGVLALALLVSLIQLFRIPLPKRLEAMRRVELASGLPHRPARGLADKISAVADDGHARALWAAEQARLLATLDNLRAGAPRPEMAKRDPRAIRFAVPVLLAVAFAVGWGEWTTRLGEAFMPVKIGPVVPEARIDAWIDPPAYTRQAPIFLSRRTGDAATQPVNVPEGSKLTVRVVSRDPAEVTLATEDGVAALAAAAENPSAGSDEAIRSYEATLDRDATIAIRHGDKATSYPLTVIEDHPPTIARGPLNVNQSGSFQLGYTVTDDYGVTEGSVTFRAAKPQAPNARPLVDPPKLPLRVDRGQAKNGTARADGRLEAHPYAGLEVTADAVVKDAAGQEARPAEDGAMTLPARPFYHPIARALIEQRQILALDANSRQNVATALDAMTIAPERIRNSSIYLGLRVGYRRLVNARTDDELRGVLDYLWQMARSIEDGDMSDAEQRLAAAREALEQALKDGASEEEIARLMDELRQAMNEYLESFRQEMAERGLDNLPQTPMNQDMQTLTDQDLQEMLDRIEELAKLGETEAAQQLLSQLQQMLDNLQMAQPGQMSPMDQEAMRQMDELARMMREQQRLMDETFEMNQGRRPGDKQGEQGPMSDEEFQRLMRELEQGQGSLAEQLQKLLEEMQGQQGQQGEGEGQQGQNGQGQSPGENMGQEMGRTLGRAGRAMGDAERSLGQSAPGDAYGHQGDALDALREGLQGLMEQMYANQPGMNGRQIGGRPQGDRDPLGRPQRTEGPDLGESVKVPDEIDVERARRILEAIRERLGERFRPRYELDYLERLLGVE